jgi:hypothetical protein
VASKFRRLDPEKFSAAQAEFKQLEAEGIVRRSTSPWSSPLHMVKKSDGSWRPCGDFRRLNLVTEPDTYPLPNMLDFAARAAGCTVFSKLDLRKGYHQIPMNAEDIAKTAIITPFGLFEFLRLPFGLRNVGNTLQRMMDRILGGLFFVFVYLDDVIVASPSQSEHLLHLQEVFERLAGAGLVLNAEKCVFAVPTVEFLGHCVTSEGALPLRSNVAAILQHPEPQNVQQLQAFLGLVNFYRRFIPGAAKILKPLTDLLIGGPKGKAPIHLDGDSAGAFQAAKEALSSVTTLVHPAEKQQISLMVDASADHVGGALQQRRSARHPWQPLDFFSRKLSADCSVIQRLTGSCWRVSPP